jgi:protein ImuA
MALDPSDLLMVAARNPVDALWAAEEGLGSGAVAAVICELIDSAGRLDLTATRRLALRSEAAGVPACLVMVGARSMQATAARTRWRIASAPSTARPFPRLLGAPVWDVELLKNRDGPCGRRRVGFCPRQRRYVEVAPEPESTGRPAFDRSGGGGARVVDFPLRADPAEPVAAP